MCMQGSAKVLTGCSARASASLKLKGAGPTYSHANTPVRKHTGTSTTTKTYTPGSFFVESCFTSDSALQPATVAASTDCILLAIPRTLIEQMHREKEPGAASGTGRRTLAKAAQHAPKSCYGPGGTEDVEKSSADGFSRVRSAPGSISHATGRPRRDDSAHRRQTQTARSNGVVLSGGKGREADKTRACDGNARDSLLIGANELPAMHADDDLSLLLRIPSAPFVRARGISRPVSAKAVQIRQFFLPQRTGLNDMNALRHASQHRSTLAQTRAEFQTSMPRKSSCSDVFAHTAFTPSAAILTHPALQTAPESAADSCMNVYSNAFWRTASAPAATSLTTYGSFSRTASAPSASSWSRTYVEAVSNARYSMIHFPTAKLFCPDAPQRRVPASSSWRADRPAPAGFRDRNGGNIVTGLSVRARQFARTQSM